MSSSDRDVAQRMPFVAGIVCLVCAVLTPAADGRWQGGCALGAPAAGAEDPSIHGQWGGPWVFRTVTDPTTIPPTEGCLIQDPCLAANVGKGIAHAVFLPMGDAAGSILLMDKAGRVGVWHPTAPSELDSTLFHTYPGPSSGSDWAGCNYNAFCSGHTPLEDGRILFVGGANFVTDQGEQETVIFNPTQTDGTVDPWEPGPFMAHNRYYPTVITMLDSFGARPLVLGGTEFIGGPSAHVVQGRRDWERIEPLAALHPCLVDAGGGAVPINWVSNVVNDPNDATEFEYYPLALQLSGASGEVFIAGDTHVARASLCGAAGNDPGETWLLTPPGMGLLTGVLDNGPPGVDRYYGSAVLLHQRLGNGGKDRVLIFGGSDGCVGAVSGCCNGAVTVHSSVQELDYRAGGNSVLIDKAPLLCPRVFSNAVVLPTGEIFISRGSITDPHNGVAGAQYTPLANPELYTPGSTKDPGSGSSQYLAAIPEGFVADGGSPLCVPVPMYDMSPPRIYHHIAMLLADGRVLVAGGDEVPGDVPHPQCGSFGTAGWSGEVLSPPYLFQGYSVHITQAPGQLFFRRKATVGFTIAGASSNASVDRVVLIRTGSVTHHQDYSQRYIELGFSVTLLGTSSSGNTLGFLEATAPGPRVGPPGYYLLFVIAKDGSSRVPSSAKIVRLQ